MAKIDLPAVETYGGLAVLFVMATEQEYGEHLKKRFRPLITGVGPVEAAAATGAALGALDSAGRGPDLIFSLGSAGSRKLEHAEIYQLASVSYRDIDASPFGFPKGVTPFLDEPAILAAPHQVQALRDVIYWRGHPERASET